MTKTLVNAHCHEDGGSKLLWSIGQALSVSTGLHGTASQNTAISITVTLLVHIAEVLKLWGAPPGDVVGELFVWGACLFWMKYGRKVKYIFLGILLGWHMKCPGEEQVNFYPFSVFATIWCSEVCTLYKHKQNLEEWIRSKGITNFKTCFPISRVWFQSLKKEKVKAVPLHAMEALGGRGGIAPTHSRPRH
jgi:hypothetical protein